MESIEIVLGVIFGFILTCFALFIILFTLKSIGK